MSVRDADAPRVSLARALSKLGACSRAQGEHAVRAGRVTVKGRTVGDANLRVDPARDRVIEAGYDGMALQCETAAAGGIECVVPSRKGCADLVLRWRN
mgnify:CR=1 FL=1